ncbi:hypothetical protein DQ04_01661000 [Trypanosoma grayi]|uniref:hypothetical protein n=1 Tax=Trypanosoma grayi TaxID=71804 RepID=UPI0004F46E89|nr:hypothetical protein DQ04_01661000 [Trypanosoma grayi]KEG12496.1 hypothetical protein DQ04_01661000 [Trypanosoma grayi]
MFQFEPPRYLYDQNKHPKMCTDGLRTLSLQFSRRFRLCISRFSLPMRKYPVLFLRVERSPSASPLAYSRALLILGAPPTEIPFFAEVKICNISGPVSYPMGNWVRFRGFAVFHLTL